MRRYQDEISVVKLSNMEMILEIERKNLASQLAGGLASLAHDIEVARSALIDGDRLPAHMIRERRDADRGHRALEPGA